MPGTDPQARSAVARRRPLSVWLVLPTYNEAANLERMVERTLPALAQVSDRPHVLVVDDDSPDGTVRIAARLRERDERVHVLNNGAKRGLGTRVRDRLRVGARPRLRLRVRDGRRLLPRPRRPATPARGARTCRPRLGSRCIAGGGIEDWCRSAAHQPRRLSLRQADPRRASQRSDSGFKCFSPYVSGQLDLDSIRSNGYAFQVELNFRSHRARLSHRRDADPLRDRRVGKSKMSAAVALEAVWRVPLLRLRRGGLAQQGATALDQPKA